MKTRALAAVAIAIACSSPALASKADFELCDGLKSPKKDGDGMRPSANRSFGLSPIAISAAARVNACTNALADPLLLPNQVVRKSNLLLARALAHISNGSPDLAIEDLDSAHASSAAFFGDAKFARSMGVSLDLVRALALITKGDFDKAQATATEAAANRPYSTTTQQIAALLLKRATVGKNVSSPYEKIIRLDPEAVEQHFAWLVETGRHKEALTLLPGLNLSFPAAPVGYPMEFGLGGPARQVVGSTISSMLAAYALAASGQGDRAVALIESTRSQMNAALEMPKPAAGVAPKNTLIEPLSRYVDQWTFLVTSRQRIGKGESVEVVKSMVGKDLPNSLVVIDLFKAIRDALPEAQKSFAPQSETLKERYIAQARRDDLNVPLIEKGLPPVEFSQSAPAYRKSSKSILDILVGPAGYQRDGFRSSENASTGIITVEFLGNWASAITVDEMTLLHGADLAIQRGKSGFIIVDRRDFSRTVTTTMGYSRVPISSAPAGYKTELDIRMVDLAALPPGGIDADRALDAKAVYAALAPIYTQAIPPNRAGAD